MKGNIKTAEEILNSYGPFHDEDRNEVYYPWQIYDAMKEYAEQFIDLAAKNVKTKESWYQDNSGSEGFKYTDIDRESILEIKNLIK